jgi:uncharacterized protein (TIGR03435 family)
MSTGFVRRSLTSQILLAAACASVGLAAGTARPQATTQASGQKDTSAAQGQDAAAQLPVFDVVSVKPHKDEGMMMRIGINATPDGFQADGVPLQLLIRQAFDLPDDRILNEPDWTKSARFDINAKVTPDDTPKMKALTMRERSEMLLPVLADRFGLKYHHETRELEVYTLVVAKGGPKLKESAMAPAGGDDSPSSASPPPPPPVPPGAGGAPGGAMAMAPGRQGGGPPGNARTMMRMSPQGMVLDARGTPMATLTNIISQQLSATVVDKTGLAGKYDFTLSFAPDPNGGPMMRPPGGPAPDGAASQEPVGPSLFAAVQEQLGLKLVAEKQAVDVVVVDHIEQPTEN